MHPNSTSKSTQLESQLNFQHAPRGVDVDVEAIILCGGVGVGGSGFRVQGLGIRVEDGGFMRWIEDGGFRRLRMEGLDG